MKESEETRTLEASQEGGRALMTRQTEGSVVVLNLLRFRTVAEQSATPGLAPPAPITGSLPALH